MKHWLVYNDGGEILRAGCTSSDDIVNKVREPGEYVMEGVADQRTQKIVDGKIVDKAPGAMPQPRVSTAKSEPAKITQEEWDELEQRVAALEAIVVP